MEKTTARIALDVEPKTKEKLRELAAAFGMSMTQFVEKSVNSAYEEFKKTEG